MKANRSGFTLVELLVVIGIISMLIALLLPAVLSGKEQARQVKCAKQMQDVTLGILQYAMRKKRFPGYADSWEIGDGFGGTRIVDVGWAPQLFAYMDMEERLRLLQDGRRIGGSGANAATPMYLEYIEFLTCPSDPPDFESTLWADSICTGAAPAGLIAAYPLNYAVNAGRIDNPAPAAGQSPDDLNWAVFHDRRKHHDGVAFDATATNPKRVLVALEDLRDGKTNTVLISENVDLVNWSSVLPLGNANSARVEFHQGIVYAREYDPSIVQDPTQISKNQFGNSLEVHFNQGFIAPYSCNSTATEVTEGQIVAENLGLANARPSSFHQEGFNVGYADGKVDFFFIDKSNLGATYDIYAKKMTPHKSD